MSKWRRGPAVVMLWLGVEKKLVKAGRGILLVKVPVKELEKTKPGKPVMKKVPKQKPRIDGRVFSQSPIQMKKVKLGGKRQKKTTNFMSEDEEDGGLGLDGRREGGEEEDNLARSSFFSHFFSSYFFSS